MQQPKGYVKKGSEHKVLKLKKALYGLHQAPRAWNSKVDVTLTALGFMKSSSEPAIYIRKSESSQLIVGMYVDDFVITRPAKFKMSDLGLLQYYLGIEVKHCEDGISLNQGA
jgi:hypothetical protein